MMEVVVTTGAVSRAELQAHLGLSTLFSTTNSSWLPWGRVAMPLISPLTPVIQLIVSKHWRKRNVHM